MMSRPFPPSRQFVFSALLLFTLSFSSCGNTDKTDQDSTAAPQDSVLTEEGTTDATDTIEAAPVYHISKQDSIKVADSVARTKNQVRDFN